MNRLAPTDNVVLIGMPYVGKSTVGVLLAKALSREFIDTDLIIQARRGRRLQEIIDAEGLDAFCRLEQETVLSLDSRRSVIATGGSVVYSPEAMAHLKCHGVIVYLRLDLDRLLQRVSGLDSRGVVKSPGQTIEELYRQRQPLYESWAQATIDCGGLSHERVVGAVIAAIGT